MLSCFFFSVTVDIFRYYKFCAFFKSLNDCTIVVGRFSSLLENCHHFPAQMGSCQILRMVASQTTHCCHPRVETSIAVNSCESHSISVISVHYLVPNIPLKTSDCIVVCGSLSCLKQNTSLYIERQTGSISYKYIKSFHAEISYLYFTPSSVLLPGDCNQFCSVKTSILTTVPLVGNHFIYKIIVVSW